VAGPHILIVGTGSAGRRHATNLSQLGARVSCYDPRPDRLEQAKREIPDLERTFGDWPEALSADAAGAVVASPPFAHVEQALALASRGVPVLLEKPVSPDLAGASRLAAALSRSRTPLLLGYSYRWWPPFAELRRRLCEDALGPLRHARLVMSAHLADWHPWERYQDFFMSSREQGGGALLDESHFLDLAVWLFGMPAGVFGLSEKLSDLEITSDDNVDAVLVYPRGLRVVLHLDLYGRPHDRSVSVVGERGTLQCLFEPHRLRRSEAASGGWEETRFDCERNDMFVAEAREFLDVLAGRARPSCTIDDGVRVLRLVEAVRRSTSEGRLVEL
jgi:predicted dehydrogenase